MHLRANINKYVQGTRFWSARFCSVPPAHVCSVDKHIIRKQLKAVGGVLAEVRIYLSLSLSLYIYICIYVYIYIYMCIYRDVLHI